MAQVTPTKAPTPPHAYEDRLINAVHTQALVLLLIEPDGVQGSAIRAYAAAARIDVDVAEAEVAELALKAAQHKYTGSRLAARVVVAEYIDMTIALTVQPPDETPPTCIEQDVCEHCGRPIRRTDVDPMWRHLEGRIGSAFCASPLDSPVATPRVLEVAQ